MLILALVLAACESGETPLGIQTELAAIHDLSLPPDAEHHRGDAVARSEYSVALAWRFETAMAWPEYVEWLQQRLPDGFERRSDDSRAAQFVRVLPADLQVLDVKRVDAGRQVFELRLESQVF